MALAKCVLFSPSRCASRFIDWTKASSVPATASASAMVRKAEADGADEKKNDGGKKPRLAAVQIDRKAAAARKIKGRTVVMAAKGSRKPGKRAVVRFASASGGRTK